MPSRKSAWIDVTIPFANGMHTWPDRRLLAPEGKNTADGYGYLAATQTRNGRIQLVTSKDHYAFNLPWIKALPTAPKK
jgi:kynurenine formamidase